ncbi:NAD(P)H:quinone oxidoreductase [Rubrivivax sp. A210]|uniref:SDR family oxidoreductase n=1 Tax=Rubrivivax sp. A210 TaxID=2772301 RepID=UPI001918B527|nr:SDR family oxidoreductase [Rubrivivax sp. A210]CAD5369695.1 NAD(P)H:quinone oxidoreductase [Rubrivivax sp. A210]
MASATTVASTVASTIAITGATGQLGRIVVRKLLARVPAAGIVALVRDPAKAADLGVAARAADYGRPETLTAALAGVQTLLLISSSEVGQRVAQHRNVIEAAQRAGVRRIVYTSLLHADRSPLSLAPEHQETESMIRASGLEWTMLRNGWYMENHTASARGALAAGALIGAAGAGRISGAPREDYAEAAVVALTGSGHAGQVYELAGDTPYTLADLAAEIAGQGGKAVPYRNLGLADYAAALQGLGLPDWLAGALAAWDVDASRDALLADGRTLSRLIGRPTTPLAAAVAQALG